MTVSLNRMRKLYRDPTFPGAFSGVNAFYKSLKKLYPNIKRIYVIKYLKTEDAYTVYKPVIRPKQYRRVFTKGINYLYEVDLVDMSKYKLENDNVTFIITLIDTHTFSKRSWAIPILSKHGKYI